MYLYYMKRRDFLRTGLVGLSSPLVLAKSTNLKINKNNPVVLSTWDFGLAANEEAIKVLNNGGIRWMLQKKQQDMQKLIRKIIQ